MAASDLVDDLQCASLAWHIEAERRGDRSPEVVAEPRPVLRVAEAVRELDVVDELVAVDPRQVFDADAGSVEHHGALLVGVPTRVI